MPRDPASRCHRVLPVAPAAIAAALSCTGAAGAEPAQVSAIDPARVQGIVRPAAEPGDGQRSVLSGLLFVPREMVRLMFLAGGVTAGLIRDEQVVPRASELLSPGPGNVSVLPWLFVDTRRRTGAGARRAPACRSASAGSTTCSARRARASVSGGRSRS